MKIFKKLIGNNIYLSPRTVDEEAIEKFTVWLNDFRVTDYVEKSAALITLEGERKYFKSKR